MTKLNAAGSALVYLDAVRRIGERRRERRRARCGRQRLDHRRHELGGLPGDGRCRRRARSTAAADAFIAELNADRLGARSTRRYLGGSQSEVGNDIARRRRRRRLRHRATRTRWTSRPRSARSTRIFNGDLVDLLGRRLRDEDRRRARRARRRPRRRRCRPRRRCSRRPTATRRRSRSRSTGATRRARRRTRSRSTTRARSPRRWCASRPSTDSMYATDGLATTTHFWRVRGVNIAGVAGPVVGRAQLHAAGRRRRPRRWRRSTQSVDGRRRRPVERHGRPEHGRAGRRRGHLAVEQQPGGRERARPRPRRRRTASPARFTIATSPVSATTTVTITATLQRRHANGDADGHAAGPEPPAATLQSVVGQPVERHRRLERAGHRHARRPPRPRRRDRRRSRAATRRRRRAGERHGRRGRAERDVRRLDERGERLDDR